MPKRLTDVEILERYRASQEKNRTKQERRDKRLRAAGLTKISVYVLEREKEEAKAALDPFVARGMAVAKEHTKIQAENEAKAKEIEEIFAGVGVGA